MGAGLNGIISNDLEWPNPGFKVTVCLQVQYLKTVRFMDKVTKVYW